MVGEIYLGAPAQPLIVLMRASCRYNCDKKRKGRKTRRVVGREREERWRRRGRIVILQSVMIVDIRAKEKNPTNHMSFKVISNHVISGPPHTIAKYLVFQ